MKRCPQCEFIYEDDQSLCDMDGVLLVFDSRTLPNLSALEPVTVPLPGKTHRRSRAVPAFATLILVVVLGLVYYVSIQRHAPRYSPANVTSGAAPSLIPATADQPAEPTPAEAPTPQPQPSESPKEARQSPVAKPTAVPASAPTRKSTTTTKVTTSKPEAKKDESKVGSILKKTGRILKKPFKF